MPGTYLWILHHWIMLGGWSGLIADRNSPQSGVPSCRLTASCVGLARPATQERQGKGSERERSKPRRAQQRMRGTLYSMPPAWQRVVVCVPVCALASVAYPVSCFMRLCSFAIAVLTMHSDPTCSHHVHSEWYTVYSVLHLNSRMLV